MSDAAAIRPPARPTRPTRPTREEEPLSVACDFGVVYQLYLRRARRGTKTWRVILKMTWEDATTPDDALRSCAFEIDLERERLVALGRKGNALPARDLPARWFCEWARTLQPSS